MRADCEADAEFTGARTNRKGEHARHTYNCDRQSDGGKSAEHNCVESIGGEHFGANVFERRGVLDGLIHRHRAHDARDRRNQCLGINARMYKQPSAKDAHAAAGKTIRHLAERVIDRDCGFGDNVLIIDIRGHPNNSARSLANADEVQHRVAPHNLAIEGILAWEYPLRDTLADDHNWFAAAPVAVIEVTTFQDGYAERREKPRRDRAELCPRILFMTAFHVAFAGKLKSGTEAAGISPGYAGSFRNFVNAWQLLDATYDFPIEIDDLIRSLAIRHHRHIHGQHPVHVKTAASPTTTTNLTSPIALTRSLRVRVFRSEV